MQCNRCDRDAVLRDRCKCGRMVDQCVECFGDRKRCQWCVDQAMRSASRSRIDGEPIDRMAQVRAEDRAAIRRHDLWMGNV